MKLNQEQHARVLDLLEVTWPSPRKCPICENRAIANEPQIWQISDSLVQMPISNGEGHHDFVVASCSNCGHSHFFHAVILGIIDEPKPAKR